MNHFKPIQLLPSLLMALGIIVASLVMKFLPDLPTFVGPVVLGLAIGLACIVDTRLHDNIPAARVFVRVTISAILIACIVMFVDDATSLRQMIPILGAMAWVSLLERPAALCAHR